MSKSVQMYLLKGLLGIRRIGRMPNAQIRELFGVKKWVDESINEVFSGGLDI